MTSIINGSSPTVTFSDGTTQATAGLPLTGGTVTGNITTSGLTIGTTALGAGNATRFKNRIINGDMRIDQRNAGASVTPTNLQYLVDRFYYSGTQASKFTAQQNAGSITPPIGYINYLGLTVASSVSITSTDSFSVNQIIEGLNIADLGWGTANAKAVTLSAWVYSSLTGTFGGALNNGSGTSYSYPFSYTIPVANTWTQISINIAGPTSGTWLTTNGKGIIVTFSLGTGSAASGTAGAWVAAFNQSVTGAVSVIGTSGATFYITGVQLEVGSSATGFEYVDYTTQLSMCQRYCFAMSQYIGASRTTAVTYATPVLVPVTMRTSPTIQSGATFSVGSGSAGTVASYVGTGAVASTQNIYIYNSASNWSTPVDVSVSAILSAEL